MEPLVFEPQFRPQIWGGRRLEAFLGRPLPGEGTFGEAWVMSAQSLMISRVAEGPCAGMTLTELWATRGRELTGRPGDPPQPFPLLLKFLDCQQLLSIQVHPSDAIARRLRPGELGKTEAWVILDAEPGATIYAGLASGVTRARLEHHLAAGTLEECLHGFTPRKGQCIFLRAGTVHAVGGGVLMAEVQQSSDVTFRLHDWNRLGPDGKPRALHLEESLASIDWSAGPVVPTLGRPLAALPSGVQGERLVECGYFSIDRYRVAGPLPLPYSGRMSIWMVIEGRAELAASSDGYRRTLGQGETVLVPACAQPLRWQPKTAGAVLLGVLAP